MTVVGNGPLSTLLSGHKRGGPPLPFWNRVQVKSYLPPQFHFLGTPFFSSFRSGARERLFAFQKMLNHCTKWWKGVPRGAKKRDQRQKSLVECKFFLCQIIQTRPWPRQFGYGSSPVWFTWLRSRGSWRFTITDPSRQYSKHVSFCMSQIDSIWSQAPS